MSVIVNNAQLAWQGSRHVVVEIPEHACAAVALLVTKCSERHNGYGRVMFDIPFRPRSTGWKSQGHHLRGHERQLAQFLGLIMSEVHQTIKDELSDWPEKQIQGPNGPKFVKLSEAEISVEVCSAAIEVCHVWAAHVGCVLVEE